jgi:hypothetical protein
VLIPSPIVVDDNALCASLAEVNERSAESEGRLSPKDQSCDLIPQAENVNIQQSAVEIRQSITGTELQANITDNVETAILN